MKDRKKEREKERIMFSFPHPNRKKEMLTLCVLVCNS